MDDDTGVSEKTETETETETKEKNMKKLTKLESYVAHVGPFKSFAEIANETNRSITEIEKAWDRAAKKLEFKVG